MVDFTNGFTVRTDDLTASSVRGRPVIGEKIRGVLNNRGKYRDQILEVSPLANSVLSPPNNIGQLYLTKAFGAPGVMFRAEWDTNSAFCLTYWQWGNSLWAQVPVLNYQEYLASQDPIVYESFDGGAEESLIESEIGNAMLLNGLVSYDLPALRTTTPLTFVWNMKIKAAQLHTIFASNWDEARERGVRLMVTSTGVMTFHLGRGGLHNTGSGKKYTVDTRTVAVDEKVQVILSLQNDTDIRIWINGTEEFFGEPIEETNYPSTTGNLSTSAGVFRIGYLDNLYWDNTSVDVPVNFEIDEMAVYPFVVDEVGALAFHKAQRY